MMQSENFENPFYLRPRFYLLASAGFLGFIFLILVLSIFTLRWVNPSFTSFTLREDWNRIEHERYSLREFWVSSDSLPDHLKWAVVASEDQLFWDHKGFDIESIREAWDEQQSGERVRGASTISQQVAKNLFLSPSQTYFRKGAEAFLTVLLELILPKKRILEIYLNIAEFGPGIFGAGKASLTFFDIQAYSLEPEMSASLAAVLPSPKRMRVNPPSPYAEERSRWILRQMSQLSGKAWIPEPETVSADSPGISAIVPDSLLEIAESELETDLFGITTDTTEAKTKPDSTIIQPAVTDTLSDSTAQSEDLLLIKSEPDSVRNQDSSEGLYI